MKDKDLIRMLDISCVRQIHTVEEVRLACRLAQEHEMAAVFVMPSHLPEAVKLLEGQKLVKPASVIGFPSGGESTAGKIYQAEELLRAGCREFDMVMNLSWLRDKRYGEISREIRLVKQAIGPWQLKVIIEASLLSREEITAASSTAAEGGADFVKTGTGWAGPSTCEMISGIREGLKAWPEVRIKATGGIRSRALMEQMYDLGCTRFGIGIQTWESIFEKET